MVVTSAVVNLFPSIAFTTSKFISHKTSSQSSAMVHVTINGAYIILKRTTVAQNEVALSYHRMRRLYFLAVIFTATIDTECLSHEAIANTKHSVLSTVKHLRCKKWQKREESQDAAQTERRYQ